MSTSDSTWIRNLVVVAGHPASGKSTFLKDPDPFWPPGEYPELRARLLNPDGGMTDAVRFASDWLPSHRGKTVETLLFHYDLLTGRLEKLRAALRVSDPDRVTFLTLWAPWWVLLKRQFGRTSPEKPFMPFAYVPEGASKEAFLDVLRSGDDARLRTMLDSSRHSPRWEAAQGEWNAIQKEFSPPPERQLELDATQVPYRITPGGFRASDRG